MCQRQIFAAPTGTGDDQALANRNTGENTIGIDVGAPAVIANRNTENNEPSVIARAQTDVLKGGSTGSVSIGDGASSDKTSSDQASLKSGKSGKSGESAGSGDSGLTEEQRKARKAKKEKDLADRRADQEKIEKENEESDAKAKAKGNVLIYDDFTQYDVE